MGNAALMIEDDDKLKMYLETAGKWFLLKV